jgi:MoxR-like ATPase
LADKLGYDLKDVRAIHYDTIDVRGMMIPDLEKGTVKWTKPEFWPTKKKTIIFLDELNAAPPLIQAAFYQLIQDRCIGSHKLPEGVVIIAAGNGELDRAVTSRMSSALANRFIHVDFDPDLQDWVAWALGHDIPTEIIAFLRFRPDLLHNQDPSRNEKAFASPRTWEFLAKLINANGSDLGYELIAGTVGEAAATEYVAFLQVLKSLPDIDMILMQPEQADVPTEPSALYAVCGALAKKASDKNIARLVKYANRLPDEFSVLLMRDAIKRNEDLASTRAWVEWVSEHDGVLL